MSRFDVALYGMPPSDPWKPQIARRCPVCHFFLPDFGECLSPGCQEARRRAMEPRVAPPPTIEPTPVDAPKAEPEAPAPTITVTLPPEVLRAALLALQACAVDPARHKQRGWQEAADALARAMGYPDGLTAGFRLLFGEAK